MSPPKVVILGTRGVPGQYGGFETFAEELSVRLVSLGYAVTVYGRRKFFAGTWTNADFEGVSVRKSPTIFHKYLETPLSSLTSFLDLFRLPAFDAAILCNAANSPFAFLVRLRGTRLFINVDGIERNRSKWNSLGKLWYRLGEFCSVAFATRVIADADVIAEYYKSTYGCRSVVIPYGVNPILRPPGATLEKFGLTSRQYILYVSRLEPENNALGVIRAYRASKIGIPLVIVGDAPYSSVYKSELRLAAEGANVIFTGFQFGESYQEFQSNCLVYVQATEVGGTHPALIESMSYGNAVIANGTPENIEVLGDAGVLYAKNDFEELSRRIVELCSDAEMRDRLGKSAKLRVAEKYSWESVVRAYADLIEGK